MGTRRKNSAADINTACERLRRRARYISSMKGKASISSLAIQFSLSTERVRSALEGDPDGETEEDREDLTGILQKPGLKF